MYGINVKDMKETNIIQRNKGQEAVESDDHSHPGECIIKEEDINSILLSNLLMSGYYL